MSEVKRPMKRYKVWKEDGPVGWSAVTDAEPGDILILASCFDELQAENAELRDQRGHNHYMLTQAVEFLRRYLNDKFYADVAEFLSEMEDTDGQD
jgi:hypothetical protein